MSQKTKTCIRYNCKQINPQPLSNFHKDKSRKDNCREVCKSCRNEEAKLDRVKNKDKIKKQRRARYIKNPEKYKQNSKQYRQTHPKPKKLKKKISE